MSTDERTRPAARNDGSVYDGFISYSHAADGLLAPRLQSALQRFAKPWWKRRAVRMFRDESSLSANPHLWSSITEALDTSGWFVLLLSPDAAESEWVNQEIAYWVEHRDASRILPVVTDGEFGWADGDVSGTAAPGALQGVFEAEPRWVDLRGVDTDTELDLQNPEFAAAVADIASAVRGIPKDELASEEVRQHRRTVRTAWAAGIVTSLLAVAASGFAISSARNADEAESNASLARSRELSSSAISVLDNDPELSILLALAALNAIPDGEETPIESQVALRRAVASHSLVQRIPLALDVNEEAWSGQLSPNGSLYVWQSAPSDETRMIDLAIGEELWRSGTDSSGGPAFSLDGSKVAFDIAFLEDGTPVSSVVLVDAVSGDVEAQTGFSTCQSAQIQGPTPDGAAWVVWLGPRFDEVCAGAGPPEWHLVLLDSTTLSVLHEIELDEFDTATVLPDGSRAVILYGGAGFRLIQLDTGEELARGPEIEGMWDHEVSPDGSLIAAAEVANPSVLLFDTETLAQVDRLTGLPHSVDGLRFSPDGRFVIAGSGGNGVIAWDVETGEAKHLLTPTGPTLAVDLDDESKEIHVLGTDYISVWDVSGLRQGEFGSVDINSWVNGNSIAGTRERAAFLSWVLPDFDPNLVTTFDTNSGALQESIAVDMFSVPAILPDGRLVVFPRHDDDSVGPVVVWDPDTDERTPLVGCRGDADTGCADLGNEWVEPAVTLVDPQATSLLISTYDGEILRFDLATLELVDRRFFDDGEQGVLAFGAGAIVLSNIPPGLPIPAAALTIVDADSFDVVGELRGGVPEFSSDASLLAVADEPGRIVVYDTATWASLFSLESGDSRIRGLEFSPDARMLAAGGTDGFLRIWDVEGRHELHRIPIESASDAYWLDDQHLAVGTNNGLWTVVTLDVDELVAIATHRLTRGFADEECETYRIDPCPTLDELRGS